MRNKILTIIVIISAIIFAEEIRNDAVLFCLKPSVESLTIISDGDRITTGNEEIDNFIQSRSDFSIEQWIKYADPKDHDGDIYLNRIYRMTFSNDRAGEIPQILDEIQSLNSVFSVETEFLRKTSYTPNDSRYGQQWFLPQINANDAWDLYNISGGELPGDRNVILASVDTGVDWDHQDLVGNLWQNLGEDADGDGHTIEYINGNWVLDPGDLNGIDDDNWDSIPDSYIDDLIGWDMSGYNGSDDNDPNPLAGASSWSTWSHGTHVAGLLGATTNNNTGIASAAFNCSIMSVKVSRGNQGNDPYITDGYNGIYYAARAAYSTGGFAIINNSWGGGGFSVYEQSVINSVYESYDAVVLAAGGNGDYGQEYAAHYPSSYENVISVAPLGTNDNWNNWATYHETIDISAPGESIMSTLLGNQYQSWDGSSMATPIVASCVGLLSSANPDWGNDQLSTMIIATADKSLYDTNPETYLAGCLGSGRVDALKALTTDLFPKLEYIDNDISIYNDSDGQINPGEMIDLRLILFNNPDWGNAVNVSGILTSDSNDLTILNTLPVSFGNINFGDAGMNEMVPFSIIFDNDITLGNINFTLTLTSNVDSDLRYETVVEFTLPIVHMTDINDNLEITNYKLMDAYPNPFNPTTVIGYQCPKLSSINLSIYNINGHIVDTIVNNNVQPGYHEIVWDATNHPSGVYIAKLVSGNFIQTQKLLLVK